MLEKVILATENLGCVFNKGTPVEKRVLQGINLKIRCGERIAVMGASGSGKSTLIQHLNGLLKPSEGRVLLHGQDIWQNKTFKSNARFQVGILFQYPEYQLFEKTVEDDVAFAPRNMGLPEGEVRERVRASLDFVGLNSDIAVCSPGELSTGEKRRVALAGVIAMQPQVLVLDEPIAGLDPRGSREIVDRLEDYSRKRKMAMIVVTHAIAEMAQMIDRIVVLEETRIAREGTPAEMLAQTELVASPIAELFQILAERGLPVDKEVWTVRQALENLLPLWNGRDDV